MKLKRISILGAALFIFQYSFAQFTPTHSPAMGGGENMTASDELSPEQHQQIFQELDASRQQLKQAGKLIPVDRGAQVLFNWPTKDNAADPYLRSFVIMNYVDHDSTYPNHILDYNCGALSYDTQDGYNHSGEDIYTYPFAFLRMLQNEVQVVAAADGQIIYKSDGNFDQNCAFNNGNWNAIYVQHSDGSVAWYGHMKNGSLTSKAVGDMVTTGEFLGVVGSSGNSTGPHLHFEVYDASNNLIDPFSGPCNNFNSSSWWVNQLPYAQSSLNHIGIGDTAGIPFPVCPNLESPNERFAFADIDTVFITFYLGYLLNADHFIINILDPSGNSYDGWIWDCPWPDYQLAYVYWTFVAGSGAPQGLWHVHVQYNGQTFTQPFQIGNINTSTEAPPNKSSLSVYPNPSKGKLWVSVSSEKDQPAKIELLNSLGQSVYSEEKKLTSGINTLSLQNENLAAGIYLLRLSTSMGTMNKTIVIAK